MIGPAKQDAKIKVDMLISSFLYVLSLSALNILLSLALSLSFSSFSQTTELIWLN